MTTLYFTVDTEYEPAFTARMGLDSRRSNFERSILGRTAAGDAGIVYQMEMLDRFGLKGVFFVCPMPSLLWGVAAIEDVVGPIVERGHDVQLHLHPEWLELAPSGRNPLGRRTGRNIKDFSFAEQCELIGLAKSILERAGAPSPVAFRAGNYGANQDTLQALATHGIRYDSSHCPAIEDSFCDIGLGPDDRRPMTYRDVVEVPAGCVENAARRLRHAQLTALSVQEIIAALRHARDHELENFTLVSHSFELLSRDRQRINRIVKRRFDTLCEEVAGMPRVSTGTFAANPPRPLVRRQPRPILPGNPLRTGLRYIEQAISNAIYGARAYVPVLVLAEQTLGHGAYVI
jgi:hypothetical protein